MDGLLLTKKFRFTIINNINLHFYVQIKNLKVYLKYKGLEGSVCSQTCGLRCSGFDTIGFFVLLKRRCIIYNVCAGFYLADER